MPLKRKYSVLILLLLVGVTLAVYWPVTGYDFVNYDDPTYVSANAEVKSGLTTQGIAWAFTTTHGANWHPLTWLSHMADCQLYALKSGRHHLTNLLIHLLNSCLVFLVLRRLTGAEWRSAAVAALFAWHPLHVESVAWVSERKDVLSTFFWLLTIRAYVEYTEATEKSSVKGWIFYGMALASFILGLLSKPMVVTMPFVLLLLDFWPLNRFSLRRLAEKAPFFLLSAAACVVTVLAQRSGGAVNSLGLVSFADRFSNAAVAYVRYLFKTVYPVDLAVIYPLQHWNLAQTGLALMILSLLTAWTFLLRKRQPYLLVGWGWFLGTLVPVIGLVQVGVQSMADRYTYIPLLGIFIVVVWMIGDLLALLPSLRRLVGVSTALLLLILLWLSGRQIRFWENTYTLFHHAAVVTSRNSEAEDNLGVWYLNQHRLPEARAHFITALDYQKTSYSTLVHLGLTAFRQGNPTEARGWLEMALRARPGWWEAHFYLGSLWVAQGNLDEAIQNFSAAVKGDSENAQAHDQLGKALARRGNLREALTQFNESIRLEPDNPELHYDLALALVVAGNAPAAILAYRDTLRLNPNWTSPMNDLAWIMATHPRAEFRNGAEAVRLAERACQLSQWREPSLIGTLDAAYAESGRFREAISTAQLTQQRAQEMGLKELAVAAANRQTLYRAGQPYRQQ